MVQIAIILIPIMGISILLPQIKQRVAKAKVQLLICIALVVYIFGNLYFTLLSRVLDSGQYLELQPFRSYIRLFEIGTESESTVTGFAALFLKDTSPLVGIILNILLYYPLGYLLPILFPQLKPRHIILIGCLFSVATEATQYLLKMGWCETDDVIHNTLGTVLGVWIWLLQGNRLNNNNKQRSKQE